MSKIHVYDDLKDVHVRATYVYNNGTDAYAYADSAYKHKFTASELQEVFVKGALVLVGKVLYKPVSMSVTSGIAKVTFVKTDSTTATTAVLGTLQSVADPKEDTE